MTLAALADRLPEHAKDLKLNLSGLAADQTLTEQQRAGAFLVSALASRNAAVTEAAFAEYGARLEPRALAAAKAAHALMAMNNIYYRFVHLAGASDYKTLPAKLRMNAMAKPGVEAVGIPRADFELWSLAVSAVNGCGMCIEAHEKQLRAHGFSAEQVQTAVRIAAVVHAIAATLEGEDAAATLARAA